MKYADVYERHLRMGYTFYILSDDRARLIEEVAKRISDKRLI